MWLVAGGTFGRRAASGFAGGRKKSCELAEGGLFSSPLFFSEQRQEAMTRGPNGKGPRGFAALRAGGA